MNYLLDTHTFIWSITEEEKLSLKIQETLADNNNSFFVSSITFWEISLKYSSGKLALTGFLPEEMPTLAADAGFKLIPFSGDEGSSFHKLIITPHKDPFDRMLIWQAILKDLTFITKDTSIGQYKIAGLKLLW